MQLMLLMAPLEPAVSAVDPAGPRTGLAWQSMLTCRTQPYLGTTLAEMAGGSQARSHLANLQLTRFSR